MNDTEVKMPALKKQLTKRQAKQILLVQGSLFIILLGASLYELYEHNFLFFVFLLIGVMVQALILPAVWKQSRRVKDGAIVYMNVSQQPQTQIPKIISVIVVLFLTGFVVLSSGFVIYIINLYFNTLIGWTICAVIIPSVWLFIFYCWYRIFTEQSTVKPIPFQEQSEGVWPPAPVRIAEADNKD
ncbi:MAG: hypothetical protein ACRYFS_01215 [Janthinobacterium lividum]